jgi:lipopolysaccharide transport system ATP-binding protein
MSTVITVENLGKKYILSHQSQKQPYVALRDVIADNVKAVGRRFISPFSGYNQSPVTSHQSPGVEDFWALKKVSFEIKQGERVGIIGRNGAGKSTLLKILSRITEPTTGRVRIKGRVASLLEVGTGFHPELTGRENIFLNGAILGMTRAEIKKKFDEIVDFAEIEKFLDTPVKRYSSGMYVRLAFAVAAHLEPEILIIDEVLAVGDAQFQKKCLWKMEDVSTKEGRTVLFVSHNMEAITNLCSKAILLKSGLLRTTGKTRDVVHDYLTQSTEQVTLREWPDIATAPGNEKAKLVRASVTSTGSSPTVFQTDTAFEFEFKFFYQSMDRTNLDVTYHLSDERGILVYVASTCLSLDQATFERGYVHAKCKVPGNLFNVGTFTVNRLLLVRDRGTVIFEQRDVLMFEVVQGSKSQLGWAGQKEGVVKPILEWELI